jgi:hypothetical protein
MIGHIYKLNNMGLKQLPCGRPVEVERTVVDPKEEKKFSCLLEKRRETKLIKVGGKFNDSS